MLPRYRRQQRILTVIAIATWSIGIAMAIADSFHLFSTRPVFLMLLIMSGACTSTGVLLTARYVGAAVARATLLAVLGRRDDDDGDDEGDGKVVRFPRR